MGFFSALMPRETRFFTLFNRHAEYVVQGGRLVADLMHELGDERRTIMVTARAPVRLSVDLTKK